MVNLMTGFSATDEVSLNGIADGVADDGGGVQRRALLLQLDLDDLLRVVPGAAGVGHEDRLVQPEERDRDQVADEEVRLEERRRPACEKNTVRKMLNMPFCAYCVQISTTFLLSSTEAFVDAFELDVRLDELDRAVGAGRHRLGRRAGEPVDHRAAGDQAEQERRVQERELVAGSCVEPVGEHHDDREDHRRGADDRRADQHRLGGGLEGVAGAVVLLEEVLGPLEVDVEAEVLLDLLP